MYLAAVAIMQGHSLTGVAAPECGSRQLPGLSYNSGAPGQRLGNKYDRTPDVVDDDMTATPPATSLATED